ncbi:MAG: DNA repair ATPase [Oceanospirillaceae bacterium]
MTQLKNSREIELDQQNITQTVVEGGAYEVIRDRLTQQSKQLAEFVESVNAQRIAEFGQAKLDVLSRVRVRTENNCIARDIVPVGDQLLFGYNVFIGLKKETKVEDVLTVYALSDNQGLHQLEQVAFENSFLNTPAFTKDFSELYIYYKQARLIQLKNQGDLLFAVFQIGAKLEDVRVFQWRVHPSGGVDYIDNRGERAITYAPTHDFEWTRTDREMHEGGSHPHINVLDTVFVETIGGQLTIKIENNTQDGLGIYQEPVEDQTQSLADADISFAQIGSLILLKITPYRETQTRYLVYNSHTFKVQRIDAIGSACVSLPEDHGIIFPGGYFLKNGESKAFPDQISGLKFKRSIRSPNGEDVLYVFYEPESGLAGLYSYNLIRKDLQNPIYAHGYSVFEDGTAVIFSAEEEATRIHPMQVWETPYASEEFAAKQQLSDSFYARIGNKELVRGISELNGICRSINHPEPSKNLYEDLIKSSKQIFDSYHWIDSEDINGLAELLKTISSTSELVIDEFEKVEQIRQQADKALNTAQSLQQKILDGISVDSWRTPQEFVECLTKMRTQRGHLISLKAQRYINVERINTLDGEIDKAFEQVSNATVTFLASEEALTPYTEQITALELQISSVEVVVAVEPINEQLDGLSKGLDLLIEVLNGLKVEDATVRTQILDDISELYAKLNQVKAKGRQRRVQLGSGEAKAEFAAQFRLFSQSVNNALQMADTPDKADEQQSRLFVQLEELESKFSEYDEYLDDILVKREELHSAFESRKQSLIEVQQRRAQSILNAAQRILKGIVRRTQTFIEIDQLNSYFAADPMVLKTGELINQLREIDDQVKADDLESQLIAAKEQAIRSLRDKNDIFEENGSIIKLGKHKFSVNNQPLGLTLLAREDGLYNHLIGTDYYQKVTSQPLEELKEYWLQELVSENKEVSRSEYLAFIILQDAQFAVNGLSEKALYEQIQQPKELLKTIRSYISQRYHEGYERGIHDTDCAAILTALIPVHQNAGLLRFAPEVRALAVLFWGYSGANEKQIVIWVSQAKSAYILATTLNSKDGYHQLCSEFERAIIAFCQLHDLHFNSAIRQQAADYLCRELGMSDCFVLSHSAKQLNELFEKTLVKVGHKQDYRQILQNLTDQAANLSGQGLKEQWGLTCAWLKAVMKQHYDDDALNHYLFEAAALILTQKNIKRIDSQVVLNVSLDNLLSEHHNIEQGVLELALDEFNQRVGHFANYHVPRFVTYQKKRHAVVQDTQAQLQLESFTAKPLTSFVRNKLIDEVYLHIIGDNLAKQMGSMGADKRTDLMGLLLLISPPGYGKTTLMEYVADRLGLVFMKINCPSLGHDVTSIDPENASNATAKQELEKLNLGLEMGNNVMLYLDDIQHTHPEFLQKFISLCDGTRRIEGVWEGESKTYDMRGKKFCVVMAGNPYTESGDVFKIPDMLANRADIYNLGDILGGREDVFALSYIENALTSNAVLAPLALREMNDLYILVAMAKGEDSNSNDLLHQYSGAELNEIVQVLKHLLEIQKIILKVNLQYIKSAATAEDYRTEPPFKLQGSYRNMNKMAEKVSAVMNESELLQLVGDHYIGEAQTLTSGAEENLLKLAMLRGVTSDEEKQRWEYICASYGEIQQSKSGIDPAQQAVVQLTHMATTLSSLKNDLVQTNWPDLVRSINRVTASLYLVSKAWRGKKKEQASDHIQRP